MSSQQINIENQNNKKVTISILKSKGIQSHRNRKDRDGNDIISGGKYKISFQSIIPILPTLTNTPQTENQNYSDSDDSDQSDSVYSRSVQKSENEPQNNQQPDIQQEKIQIQFNYNLEVNTKSLEEEKVIPNKKIQKNSCCILF